jgi:hypothetical protein
MMNYYAPWVDPRVKLVRKEHLMAYLRSHGWQDEGIVRTHFVLFRHPIKKAPVQVPGPEESDDDGLLIFEAVTELARIEDRYAGDVLTDLLSQPVGPSTHVGPPSVASKDGALAQTINQ